MSEKKEGEASKEHQRKLKAVVELDRALLNGDTKLFAQKLVEEMRARKTDEYDPFGLEDLLTAIKNSKKKKQEGVLKMN